MDGDFECFLILEQIEDVNLTVLTQYNLDDFLKKKFKFLTMTSYNDDYENVSTIYENENLKDTLGEVLENENKNQSELLKLKNIHT